MVSSITQGADTETLAYDPDHPPSRCALWRTSSRGSLSDSSSGDTTWYFSNPAAGAMSEMLQGSTDSWRDYMMAYGHIVAERFDTAGTPSVYYFVGDHLASTTTLTDASQNQKEYDAGACPPAALCADRGDAWGKRRDANGSDISNCISLDRPPSLTLHGITGQGEMDARCAGCKSFLRVRFPPLSCSVEVNHLAAANDRDAISYGRRLLFR